MHISKTSRKMKPHAPTTASRIKVRDESGKVGRPNSAVKCLLDNQEEIRHTTVFEIHIVGPLQDGWS